GGERRKQRQQQVERGAGRDEEYPVLAYPDPDPPENVEPAPGRDLGWTFGIASASFLIGTFMMDLPGARTATIVPGVRLLPRCHACLPGPETVSSPKRRRAHAVPLGSKRRRACSLLVVIRTLARRPKIAARHAVVQMYGTAPRRALLSRV